MPFYLSRFRFFFRTEPMNRWNAFTQLLLARLREFYREPEALFWVYGFPILLAVGLGIAFASNEPQPPTVDIQGRPEQTEVRELLELLEGKKFTVRVSSPEEALERLTSAKTDLVIEPTPEGYRFHYDKMRTEALMAFQWTDAVLLRKAHPETAAPEKAIVEIPGNRYIDFLIPGLMGLNLMGGGLWGVGFVIVDMRIRKLLKRMVATPMRRADFLLAILTARLVFLIPDMLILLLCGWLIFGVPVNGNPLTLALVVLVGAASFSGIGLLAASRAKKTETISGLMNLIMLPMWLLSGVFFSSERFPEFMQPFIQALPLTQLNNALREVMLKDYSLVDISWRLLILAAWGVVPFFVALKVFRWR
jgi:ABC-2 type transport system permease protein